MPTYRCVSEQPGAVTASSRRVASCRKGSSETAHQQQRGVGHRDEAEHMEGEQAQREGDREEGDRRCGLGVSILRASLRG